MRLMGHRDGKGIGAPLSRRALELQRLAEQRAMRGKKSRFDRTAVEEAEEFARSFEFIPEDVPPVYFSSQDNTHGLGYSGLKGLSGGYNTVTGEQAGGSKRGDAFGVGVFEDSDDDVYDADDLSGYNKVLGDRDPILAITSGSAANVGEISFVPAKKTRKRPTYEPIVVPPGFNPRHTPIPFDPSCLPVEVHAYGSRMTPLQKAMILGEKATSIMDLLSQEDRQKLREARRLVEERKNAPKPAKKVSEAPKNIFSSNPEKAQRFDQFLMCLRRGSAYHRQPGLTDAEWAREEADFQRAVPSELRHLLPAAVQRAQPLFKGGGLTESLLQAMKNKFVATSAEPKADDVKPKQKPPLTLVSHTWHPAKRLCVRLNVPDPYPNSLLEGIPGRVSVSKTPKGGFTTTAIEQEIARQRRGFFPEDEPSSSQQESTDENPSPAAESTEPPESEPLFEFFDFMDSIFGTTDAEVRESEQAQAELSAERPREDPKPLTNVQSSSEAKAGDIQLRERPKKVIQLMDDDDEEDGAPVFQPGASRVPVRPKEPPAPLTGPKEGFREEMSAEKLSSPVLKVPAPVPAPEVKVEEVLPAEVSTQTVSDSSDVRSSSEEERKRKKHRNRKKKEREEREREREHRKKKEKKSKKRDRHRDRDRDEDEDDRKSRKSKKDKKEKHRREHSSSSRSRSKSKSSKSKRHHHHRSRHDRSRSRSESNSTLPSIASDSG